MGAKTITRNIVKETSLSGAKERSKKLAANRKFQEDSRNGAALQAKKDKVKAMKAEIKELEGAEK